MTRVLLCATLALILVGCDSPTAPVEPVVDPVPTVGGWMHMDAGVSDGYPVVLEQADFSFVVLYASASDTDWHISSGIRILRPGVVEVDIPAGWSYAVFYHR